LNTNGQKYRAPFGYVSPGEFVVWWVSHDKQSSLAAASGSYGTKELAFAAAEPILDDPYYSSPEGQTLRTTGFLSVECVND